MAFTNVPDAGGACSLRVPSLAPVTGDIQLIAGTNITITEDQVNGTFTIANSGEDTGITELTGDVTAGPGSGAQAATVVEVGGVLAADVASASSVVAAALTTDSLTLDSSSSPAIHLTNGAAFEVATILSNVATSDLAIQSIADNADPATVVISAANDSSNSDWIFHQKGSLSLPQVAGDPAAPTEGDIWYNVTSHTWRGYDGTNLVTFNTTAD